VKGELGAGLDPDEAAILIADAVLDRDPAAPAGRRS
jgi:hypothetical protein